MIDTKSIYDDVLQEVTKEQNGLVTRTMFNSFSRRAENNLMDVLTGKIEMDSVTAMYVTQKNKDWLSEFITPKEGNVVDGKFPKPTDYYGYENMYLITADQECDEDDDDAPLKRKHVSIQLLDGSKFDQRTVTYIKALRPSMKKPIVKMVGKNFEFAPSDLGSVRLEYIRLPKFATLKSVVDEEYNNVVLATENPYEWPEGARNYLVNYIVSLFAIGTRDQVLTNQTLATKKDQ